MAIITLAAPISGIRGKVGGLVFSANKSGPFVKSWARGSNPRTFSQTGHRANLTALAITWRSITSGQRTAWDVYAALAAQDLTNSLGETYSASGFNWFIRINLNRIPAGDAFTAVAPTLSTPATPTIESLSVWETDSVNDTFIELAVASPGLGERCVIKAELVGSSGILALSAIKTFMITTNQIASNREYSFKPELLAHFGTAQIGQRLFCTIQQQDSEGRRSAVASINGVVT